MITKLKYYLIIGIYISHVFAYAINCSKVKLANVNARQYVKKIYINLFI